MLHFHSDFSKFTFCSYNKKGRKFARKIKFFPGSSCKEPRAVLYWKSREENGIHAQRVAA